jgi:tetratricopeptide (TPR) repeat protein
MKLRMQLLLICTIWLSNLLCHDGNCRAQVTAENLLAESVEKIGPQDYPLVRSSIDLLKRGDFVGARKVLLDACKQDPKLPPADLLLAKMLLSLGDATSGRNALESAVAQNPNDPDAYVLLGELALGERRWTEAELLFARSVELAENVKDNTFRHSGVNARCFSGLATVAESRGNWTEAEQWMLKWTKLEPKSMFAQVRLARAIFHQQRLREAFEIVQQVHKDNPETMRPEVRMAYLYEELAAAGDPKKHESAIRAVQQAVTADPDSLANRLEVARWAMENCEIDIAEDSAKAALKLDGTSFDAMILVGLVARHRKDPATAEKMFLATSEKSKDAGILAQLAMSLAEQDDAEKQRSALELAKRLSGNNDYSQSAARNGAVISAWVMYRMNELKRAAEIVSTVVQVGPLSEEVNYLAALILSESGNRDTALQLVRAALANNRCFPMREDARALLAKLEKP